MDDALTPESGRRLPYTAQDDTASQNVKELRALIAIGLGEADRGLSAPWDPEQIKAKLRTGLA